VKGQVLPAAKLEELAGESYRGFFREVASAPPSCVGCDDVAGTFAIKNVAFLHLLSSEIFDYSVNRSCGNVKRKIIAFRGSKS
jgi:hypothetical protein